MNPKTRRLSSLLILALAVTAAGAEAAVLSGDPSAVRVEGIHADDHGAYVTVANPAPVSRSGILLVKTFVAGREVELAVRFRLQAGATATFDVPLPSGSTVLDCSIVLDDGSPL